MTATNAKLSITLVKSPIGAKPSHRDCVRALGLRRMQQTVVLPNSPTVRGIINKIIHLLNVQEV